MELDGPRHGAAPGAARALVVLLHGLGADGHDLISLAPLLGQDLPEGFQSAEFLQQQGFVDLIVDRRALRKEITHLLDLVEG